MDDGDQRHDECERDPDDHALPTVTPSDDANDFDTDPFGTDDASEYTWGTTRRRPRTRAGRWVLGAVCIVVAVAFIAAQVVH